jgi:hypothetical protein
MPDFFAFFCPKRTAGSISRPWKRWRFTKNWRGRMPRSRWCVWNGNTHWTAAQLSPEAAGTIHANPDVITANNTRTSGQAQVAPGGFRVNGRWSLVSGCELGTWMVLLCVVHGSWEAASDANRSA